MQNKAHHNYSLYFTRYHSKCAWQMDCGKTATLATVTTHTKTAAAAIANRKVLRKCFVFLSPFSISSLPIKCCRALVDLRFGLSIKTATSIDTTLNLLEVCDPKRNP